MTLKIPAIIDAVVLKTALGVAQRSGTSLRIETFYRIRHDEVCSLDCDTEREVLAYADTTTTSMPESELEKIRRLCVAAGMSEESTPSMYLQSVLYRLDKSLEVEKQQPGA